jgi:biopolymer transport protein ExbB
MNVPMLMQLMLAQDAKPADSKSLISYIHDGGPVGYVILCLSFVAVALIVRNLIQIRAVKLAPPEAVHRLDVMLRENDVNGAVAFCLAPENDSFLTRLFGTALTRCSRSPFGFLELKSALEEAGFKEVERLHRSNDGIGLIAGLGPMLGLLGTVLGMIGAFYTLGKLEGAARSQQLAGYMAIALTTTAMGLVVAIPCTAAFALFRRRIEGLVDQVSGITEELAGHVEQAGGGGGAAVAPRPTRPHGAVAGGGAGHQAPGAHGGRAMPEPVRGGGVRP